MKSRKWAVMMSAAIMIISLIIFAVMNFCCYKNDWTNFYLAIGSGAFTSSMVTLLISITEYSAERLAALENFAEANIYFRADFYNMKYLNFTIPFELLQGYYAEQRGNSLRKEPQAVFREKIKEYLWENLNEKVKNAVMQGGQKEEYLEEDLKRTIEKYDEEIDAIMKQYIVLDEKVSSRELTATIGKIDFLFGNKYRKNVLYKRMYSKQRDVINTLHEKTYHFRNYYSANGKGNMLVMLSFIRELQEYFFTVNTEENEVGIVDIVYNQYLYDIDCEIDSLLRNLYGGKKYDTIPKISDYRVVEYWKKFFDKQE